MGITRNGRAFWWESRNQGEIRIEAVSGPNAKEVQIKALYSLISPGTESLIGRGGVPKSQWNQMRCAHMGGEFPFPVKYGYSIVGEVVDGDAELLGRKAHMMYPHQELFNIGKSALAFIPENVPVRRACLASNLETALTGIWDSELKPGESVLVAGFGAVGSLIATLSSMIPGVEVFVFDKNKSALSRARKWGFDLYGEERARDLDLSFHCSGNPAACQLALDALGHEGRLVELSWYGDKETVLRMGESFHRDRKRIISSQVSSIPGSMHNRWDFTRRKHTVFRLLGNQVFDRHLGSDISLKEMPRVMQTIASEGSGLPPIVRYDS